MKDSISASSSVDRNVGGFSLCLHSNLQRLYGRLHDLRSMLDLMAQAVVDTLEQMDPRHAKAASLLAAAGVLGGSGEAAVYEPLALRGRPDPAEVAGLVGPVGPGSRGRPVALIGWCTARRKIAYCEGERWFVADRDDAGDCWGPLRPAEPEEASEMRSAAIAAYPTLRTQFAVPILDPEIRGQRRPREPIGVLDVESEFPFAEEFRNFLVSFASSLGHPLKAAMRQREQASFLSKVQAARSRASLAQALLGASVAWLPRGEGLGFVAFQDRADPGLFRIEAMDPPPMATAAREALISGRLMLPTGAGPWSEAVRGRRTLYVPDTSRLDGGSVGHSLWEHESCLIALPLLRPGVGDCIGLLGLACSKTTYALSAQDRAFLQSLADLGALAASRFVAPAVEYPGAVRLEALRKRNRRVQATRVTDDQIVRINTICRSLIECGFDFERAAEVSGLTVHILREYTSRSPRVIDVEALRAHALATGALPERPGGANLRV